MTTNFRPFEAVILHLVTRVQPDMPWSGWTTATTPRPPTATPTVTRRLGLNLKTYLPLRSRAHRETVEGPRPRWMTRATVLHAGSKKLEPFARALREQAGRSGSPALRASDSAVRAQNGARQHQPRPTV